MGKLTRSTIIKNQPKKKNTKVTVEELVDLAEEAIDRCELEIACKYAKQALDIEPKSVAALNTMASIQMEMGNNDSAKNIYKKLVELNPNEGFNKYMCLAQLSDELEAVEFYKKGIELMLVEYSKQDNEQTSKPGTSSALEGDESDEDYQLVKKSDISTAYGSIAEIYLTDLCMEENAEELCKSYLDKSLEYEPNNPESLQLMASYWLSKADLDQARKYILESLDNWLPKYIEASESGLLVDPTQVISLTYDSRINTSRILTEVDEFDKAITVLEQLVEEDDEVVVVWYMLGWVNYCKGEEYFGNAKYYLKKSSEMAAKIKYDQKYLDEGLRAHIVELLEKLTDIATDDEEDEKENMNSDEEYETDPEEEEEEAQSMSENNGMKSSASDLKAINKLNKKLTDANNNTVEEPMET